MFSIVLAPQSTHPPLSKKGFQHSKIFSIFLKLSPEYYYPLHEVLSYTAVAFFSFVHDTILSFEKKSIASQATQNIFFIYKKAERKGRDNKEKEARKQRKRKRGEGNNETEGRTSNERERKKARKQGKTEKTRTRKQ